MNPDAPAWPESAPRLISPQIESLSAGAAQDPRALGLRARGRDADGRQLQVDVFSGDPPRVFVHEDVATAVEAVVPPRAVPWSRRLFWELVFVLMRHRPTRDWLLRRYSR
jgi:hypothetical protein